MRLTGDYLITVLPESSAVGGEGHLECCFGAFESLHAKTRPERSGWEIRDELFQGSIKLLPLLPREPVPLAQKPLCLFVGGQAGSVGACAQGRKKVFTCSVERATPLASIIQRLSKLRRERVLLLVNRRPF